MSVIYILYSLGMVTAYRYLPENEIPPSYPHSNRDKSNKYTASILDVPYQILIVYSNFYCSGALIRSRVAVTAASCFMKHDGEVVVVKIGSSSINGPGQVIVVTEIKKHEYFTHLSDLDNDIALILLQDDVIFGENVKKGILVDPEVAIRVGTNINAYGWGGSNLPTKFTNKIIVSQMAVIDKNVCQQYYGHLLSSSSYCARYQSDRRMSDNGGPVTYGELVVGILSFGAASKQEPFVAVITNISYFHRWIKKNSMRFFKKYCQNNIDDNIIRPREFGILS